MKTLNLLIKLNYDADTIHGDDEESAAWFIEYVLRNPSPDCGLLLHSNEIGDVVGEVRVLEVMDDLIECRACEAAHAYHVLSRSSMQNEPKP